MADAALVGATLMARGKEKDSRIAHRVDEFVTKDGVLRAPGGEVGGYFDLGRQQQNQVDDCRVEQIVSGTIGSIKMNAHTS